MADTPDLGSGSERSRGSSPLPGTSSRAAGGRAGHSAEALRVIACFKLIKGAALLLAGFGMFRLLHRDVAAVVEHWVEHLRIDPHNRIVGALLVKVGWLDEKHLEELGFLTAAYGALFLTEGVGLWMRKRWAEWFTVFATGSLIPFELFELSRKVNAIRIALFLANVAIVVYLIALLKRNGTAAKLTRR